jgi:hypothetical protein
MQCYSGAKYISGMKFIEKKWTFRCSGRNVTAGTKYHSLWGKLDITLQYLMSQQKGTLQTGEGVFAQKKMSRSR